MHDKDARVDHSQYDQPFATAATVVAGSGHLTADDLDNVRHMLGVSDKHRRGYRNYRITAPDAETPSPPRHTEAPK
jgi:hypothetical protein